MLNKVVSKIQNGGPHFRYIRAKMAFISKLMKWNFNFALIQKCSFWSKEKVIKAKFSKILDSWAQTQNQLIDSAPWWPFLFLENWRQSNFEWKICKAYCSKSIQSNITAIWKPRKNGAISEGPGTPNIWSISKRP